MKNRYLFSLSWRKLLFLLSIFTTLSSAKCGGGARAPQRYSKEGSENNEDIAHTKGKTDKVDDNALLSGIDKIVQEGGAGAFDNGAGNRKADRKNGSENSKNKKLKQSFILYSGLGVEPEILNNLQQEIEQNGGKAFLSTIRRGKTAILSIDEQYDLTIKEAEEIFGKNPDFLRNAQKYGLVYLGQSQGGIFASLMGKDKQFNNKHGVKDITAIPIQSPAGGGLDGNYKAVDDVKKAVIPTLKKVKTNFTPKGIDAGPLLNDRFGKETFPATASKHGISGMAKAEVAKKGYGKMGNTNTIVISSQCSWLKLIIDVFIKELGLPVSSNSILPVVKNYINSNEIDNIQKLYNRVLDDSDNDGVVPISSQEAFSGSNITKIRLKDGVSHMSSLTEDASLVVQKIVEKLGS